MSLRNFVIGGDKFMKNRKRCILCGCIMGDKHDGDVCECCKDDMEDREDEEVKS